MVRCVLSMGAKRGRRVDVKERGQVQGLPGGDGWRCHDKEDETEVQSEGAAGRAVGAADGPPPLARAAMAGFCNSPQGEQNLSSAIFHPSFSPLTGAKKEGEDDASLPCINNKEPVSGSKKSQRQVCKLVWHLLLRRSTSQITYIGSNPHRDVLLEKRSQVAPVRDPPSASR